MNERIYRGEDDSWYYRARGNDAVGPFLTRQAAETALSKQVRSWARKPRPRAVWTRHLPSNKLFRRSAPRHG